jgi:Ser-tRNA(Ala) deacylase AlaX
MPSPPHPGKISPPVEMPAKSPEKAYVVVLKLMDSWCLVGKKVFMKFDDAERFRLRAQETAEKILDTEEVKLMESYVPPRE